MRPSSLSFFFLSPFAETLPALRAFCARAARFLFRFAYTSIMSMTSSFLRVENNGFEPLTPCLQSRCSSQLS